MSKITTTLVTGQQYTQEYAAEVKSSVNTLYDQVGSYKSYVAMLSQSGTATPAASINVATLDTPPAFNYGTVGTYQVLLTGIIPPSKLYVNVSQKGAAGKRVSIDYFLGTAGSNTLITIRTYNNSNNALENDILDNTPIEIRVYS